MKKAFLSDLVREIKKGAELEFVHGTGRARLLLSDAESVPVDGRAYHSFVEHHAPSQCEELRFGSLEGRDLMIVWRRKKRTSAVL